MMNNDPDTPPAWMQAQAQFQHAIQAQIQHTIQAQLQEAMQVQQAQYQQDMQVQQAQYQQDMQVQEAQFQQEMQGMQAQFQQLESKTEQLESKTKCQEQRIHDLEREKQLQAQVNQRQAHRLDQQEQRILTLEKYGKDVFDQLMEEHSITTRGEAADFALNAIARDLARKLNITYEKFITIQQIQMDPKYRIDLTYEQQDVINGIVDELQKLKEERHKQNHSVEKRKRIQDQEIAKVCNVTINACKSFRTDVVSDTLPSLEGKKLKANLEWFIGKKKTSQKKNFIEVNSPPKSEDERMPFASPVKSPAISV